MIRGTRGVVLTIWVALRLSGQSAGVGGFEVASVKVHAEPPHIIGVKTTGMRLIADAETVRGLIMWAYNLKNFQVAGPGQESPVGDTFFDVVAKAEGEKAPSRGEFRQMLQALLADRFKLKVHRETREMPVYALVVGKNGPKLKPSAPDAGDGGRLQVVGRNYEHTVPKATMNDVVDGVANSMLDRPVVDQTGLTGTYDLKLVYTPERTMRQAAEGHPEDLSIFTAVQEQLGLKLEPRRADVEILVVDHVEKPSEN
jgi:uncharacterized protein (TIGR03435 family)